MCGEVRLHIVNAFWLPAVTRALALLRWLPSHLRCRTPPTGSALISTCAGEPELAVATHVLCRPIAVYMLRHTGLQQISCYGEGQHGSAASVPLLFHGAGHYDLLLRQPMAAAPRSLL
ncbi:hypothetical protein COHA_010015 [Chlorella ohadii]|uniref:Ubiquitin thioesterase OTU n=1 Tax=Chlorella ohadii TaxID=2649997 RepID=A0AAD5DDJ1_9CHLO|nr:hypothetical protein COHA_010015 [Chlorella ohadii]